MSRGPCTFRQRDLTAALKAAKAAGCGVQRVVIDKAGRLVLETAELRNVATEASDERNEWDENQ